MVLMRHALLLHHWVVRAATELMVTHRRIKAAVPERWLMLIRITHETAATVKHLLLRLLSASHLEHVPRLLVRNHGAVVVAHGA